jgi:maltose O-acetyltransferase
MRIDQTILLTVPRVLKGLRRRLRTFYYSRVMKSMGKGCAVCDGVLIVNAQHISLGNNVSLCERVLLQACEGATISLGTHVTLSYGSMILTGGIDLEDRICRTRHKTAPVVIEDNACVCSRAVILPGVTIGRSAIVAPGSLVIRDVPRDVIVSGVPARVVHKLSECPS